MPWTCFQEEEPLQKDERSWITKEAILEYFDQGSDSEDVPHQLEKYAIGNTIYEIKTAQGVTCCFVSENFERLTVHEDELTLTEPPPSKKGEIIEFPT